MYCPTCGNEIKNALNFCNRCGGKIEKSETARSVSNYQSIATTVGVVGLGGFIAIIVFAMKLLDKNVDITAVVAIIFMFLVTILAIIFMAIRLMPKYLDQSEAPNKFHSEYVSPKNLRSANTAQLNEPTQFPASVVEETTRTLDEVLLKRN